MNPRLRYSQKTDKFILQIDGSQWPYLQGNKESMRRAMESMDAHGTKVLVALDSQAGKTLSDKELLYGIDHPDFRTIQEQVAAEQEPQRPHFDSSKDNPFKYATEKLGLDKEKRKETRAEMWQRRSDSWEAEKAQKDAEHAFSNDAKRIRAVQHAQQELTRIKFDPSVSKEEQESAQERLQLALTGDLAVYAQLDREWRQTKAKRIEEKQQHISQQIDSLRQQGSDLENQTFELPTPQPEAPQKPKYEKISADDPRHPQYINVDQNQREARHAASQSPAIG